MSGHAERQPDLRARVLGGLAWTGIAQVGLQVTRVVVALLVARLLTPAEYGLAAMALVFASLVLVFSDLALGAALVQRKTLTDEDRNTAFWITTGSGLLFTGVAYACAGPVASAYGQPEAQPLLEALAPTFLIYAIGATQQSLMLRDMEFRRLELLPLAGALAGGASAIVMATLGAGAWAIIVQQIVTVTITTALIWWRSTWRPRLQWSRASAEHLMTFSTPLIGHRLLYYVQQNADRFLVGKYVGTAGLGAYAIAYNTIVMPASRIGGPLQRVLAPAFARMQDEPLRIAAAWTRVTRLVAVVAVPALLGLIVVANDFVTVILGERWEAAAPLIQILAWVGILQALQSVNVDILIARDRTTTIFRYTLLFCTVHLVGFAVGLHWGVTGVAASYAISSTLVEPVLTVVTARALTVSVWAFVRGISGVFQASIAMAAVVFLAQSALTNADVAPALRLAACIAVGIVTFVPLCAWRVPELAEEIREARSRRLRGPAAPAGLTVPADPAMES